MFLKLNTASDLITYNPYHLKNQPKLRFFFFITKYGRTFEKRAKGEIKETLKHSFSLLTRKLFLYLAGRRAYFSFFVYERY